MVFNIIRIQFKMIVHKTSPSSRFLLPVWPSYRFRLADSTVFLFPRPPRVRSPSPPSPPFHFAHGGWVSIRTNPENGTPSTLRGSPLGIRRDRERRRIVDEPSEFARELVTSSLRPSFFPLSPLLPSSLLLSSPPSSPLPLSSRTPSSPPPSSPRVSIRTRGVPPPPGDFIAPAEIRRISGGALRAHRPRWSRRETSVG